MTTIFDTHVGRNVPTTGIVDLDLFKISTRVPVKPEFQNLLEMEMDGAEGA